MKTIHLLLISLLFASAPGFAQSGKIPPFRMTQADGKVFKAEDLPMGKPILIVYFSPDCDHCEIFIRELLKWPAEIKNVSIALITFLPVDKLIKFRNDFKISQYPNIYVGTEGTSFFVRNYYKISDIPYTALYDKSGNLIYSYEKDIPVNTLIERIKRASPPLH